MEKIDKKNKKEKILLLYKTFCFKFDSYLKQEAI